MVLMGNFETMSLAELFQWIGTNQKSGTLKIIRGRLAIKIFFREGDIHGTSSNEPPAKLGQFLISRGKITEDILNSALAAQENQTNRTLGSILVEVGAVSEEELQRYCVAKAEEAIFGLINLEDAHFEFDPEGRLDSTMVKMERDVQDLLLHVASQRDELERMRGVFRGPDVVLCRTELGLSRETASSSMARRIYAAIDGKRSFAEIILHTRASEYMATKFIYEMYRRGIVQVAKVREAAPQPGSPEAARKLAQQMRERGEHEVALEILTAAAKVEPNHAGLRRQLEATETTYLTTMYKTELPPTRCPSPRLVHRYRNPPRLYRRTNSTCAI